MRLKDFPIIGRIFSRFRNTKHVEQVSVSVIIPSYNRFKFLENAVRSVQNQTHKNVEIIVVNDGSTESEYYSGKLTDVKLIHNEENTKSKYGFANLNHVRNIGLKNATGRYIAFLDDDDIWLPNKLENQLQQMLGAGYEMSCSDGFLGVGVFDSKKGYKLYNREHYYDFIFGKYKAQNSDHYFENGNYPRVWTRSFLEVHNCITTCSVLVSSNMIEKAGLMPESEPPGEDYEYWLRLLEYGEFFYVEDPGFYCDKGHGYGRNY